MRTNKHKLTDLSALSGTPSDKDRHLLGLEINYNVIKGVRQANKAMLPSISSQNTIEQKKMAPINHRLGHIISNNRNKNRMYQQAIN